MCVFWFTYGRIGVRRAHWLGGTYYDICLCYLMARGDCLPLCRILSLFVIHNPPQVFGRPPLIYAVGLNKPLYSCICFFIFSITPSVDNLPDLMDCCVLPIKSSVACYACAIYGMEIYSRGCSYTCIHTFECTYTHASVLTHTLPTMHTHMCSYIHTGSGIQTHTQTHTHTINHTTTYTYTHIQAYIHTRIHTYRTLTG